ncbi:hypothetical protein TW65_05087 [Stemphylium lycopersici]|nr:hypothetical protein TW65_05087 [Stemphylium lycopersici]
MDHVDASVELIHLVCATLIFIRDVTKDATSYTNTANFLNKTLVFLDVFSNVCFGDVTGVLRDRRVHRILTCDVEYSLYSLNKSLAAHREAWRYVGRSPNPGAGQRSMENLRRGRAATLDAQYEWKSWRDEIKERSQLWREKARPGLYNALFGEEEIMALTSSCLKWTHRLRQCLEIVFLGIGPPTAEFGKSREAAVLGVSEQLERQHRAGAEPSSNYNALVGALRDTISTNLSSNGLIKTIYDDGGEEVDVLVEPRSDSETPSEYICHLTWLLQAPHETDVSVKSDAQDGYQLHTLSCLGYIDDPLNRRSLIIYRAPQSHPWASNPPSLHDMISKGPTARPSIGTRFLIARALTTTLLESHASGWVHGNVQSRSISMLPRSLNDLELSPFFVGWGVLQPLEANYFPLEPNLYRHHDRFGRPFSEYANEHEVYSIGVVLLELGLWRTMARVFARRLEKFAIFGAAQQHDLFNRIHNAMLDWANSIEIEREMGKSYAQVVLKCLTWHYHDPVEGMIEFRKQVRTRLAVAPYSQEENLLRAMIASKNVAERQQKRQEKEFENERLAKITAAMSLENVYVTRIEPGRRQYPNGRPSNKQPALGTMASYPPGPITEEGKTSAREAAESVQFAIWLSLTSQQGAYGLDGKRSFAPNILSKRHEGSFGPPGAFPSSAPLLMSRSSNLSGRFSELLSYHSAGKSVHQIGRELDVSQIDLESKRGSNVLGTCLPSPSSASDVSGGTWSSRIWNIRTEAPPGGYPLSYVGTHNLYLRQK